MSIHCPHCNQRIAQWDEEEDVFCPRCGGLFRMQAPACWTAVTDSQAWLVGVVVLLIGVFLLTYWRYK